MAIYTVHLPPDTNDALRAADRARFVREGLSFSAFVFGPFWLAWNRMWRALVGYAIIWLAIGALGLALTLPWPLVELIAFLVALFLGLEGRSLMRASLERRGLHVVDVVSGADREDAERAFFARWSPPPVARLAPPATRAGTADEQVIGMFPEAGGV